MRIVNPRGPGQKNAAGFSLVEVAAAIVIIGISLVSVQKMFAYGARARAMNEQRLIVVNLLRDTVEQIKCKPFSEDVSGSYNITEFPDYFINVNQNGNYDNNPYLKRIDVDINWTSPFGDGYERLSTLIADRS